MLSRRCVLSEAFFGAFLNKMHETCIIDFTSLPSFSITFLLQAVENWKLQV
jgi:hypothetical protein